MHRAEAVEPNEMLYSRQGRVTSSNILLDNFLASPCTGKGD